VFFTIASGGDRRFGNIITTPFEHQSVLNCIDTGYYSILHIPLNPDFTLDVAGLRRLIKDREFDGIDLISCMYANNEIGTIFQIKEIGAIAKKFNIPFHCDATQIPAWQKIDVTALNVDYLTLSGHKMYGPKGIGVLYVADDAKIEPMFCGGEQEFGKRAGTPNMSGIVGFTKALELCEEERKIDSLRIGLIRTEIEKIFREDFREVDFSINGGKNRLPNNISITFPNLKPGLLELVNEKIAVSDGSACQVGVGAISHVLSTLGYKQDSQTLRIGLGRFTTEEDGKVIAETIVQAVKQLS
jgi:cysteine desulfurase